MRVPWQVKFGVLALIWGASFLLMKVGLEALAPVQIATLRIVSGAVTVLLTALVMGVRLPPWGRVWGHLFVAGFVLCSLPFTLFPLGEERVSSALAGIGNATTPLSAVLFTLLLLPNDRVSPRTVVAVVAGFLGVVVIMQPWDADRPAGRRRLRHDAARGGVVRAGVDLRAAVPHQGRHRRPRDAGGPAAHERGADARRHAGVVVLHRDGEAGGIPAPWSPVPGAGPLLWPVVAILVLGVVGTGLAFALQYDVVREVGPTVGASVTYVIPVVAVVLGMVFLHERLQWPQVAGAAIVLASAVIIGRTRRPVARLPRARSSTSWSPRRRRQRPHARAEGHVARHVALGDCGATTTRARHVAAT